jgi:type III restriction enzyme
VIPGKLPLFSNEQNGTWSARPNTILVDSAELESGEAMSAEFKKIAASEIEEFKDEYRQRFPDRSVDLLTDEDLLREVMNTVGKPGKLGEQIRCVVSVSMLTEGWDANSVTHILGVRAFGTQLLCEQVVGRGLRRMSYVADEHGVFSPEYAEVYGVPFAFIPTSGSQPDPKLPKPITHVQAREDRRQCEITFPHVLGYRYDLPQEMLDVHFDDKSRLALSTADIATWTENAPIVGETSIHRLDDLKERRLQEVDFDLAKLVLEKYFRRDGEKRTDRPKEHHFDPGVQAWLFPQVLPIARRWRQECVVCKDNTFPQLLLLVAVAHDAADRIYHAIVSSTIGAKIIKPILRPYDTVGSTRYVDFDTTRPAYPTHPEKCHINYVMADTGSWEQKMAQALEDMPEVLCYVKNQNLGFTIPYTLGGEERGYIPDFIVRLNDRHGSNDLLSLILEVSGEPRKDKAAKVATARDLWVPAVNNHGGFGRWAFLEISDPWDAQKTIRGALIRSSEE